MRTWNVSCNDVCTPVKKSVRRTFFLSLFVFLAAFSFAQNDIVTENLKPGVPRAVWDGINSSGDATIQGFATDMSVNKGNRINFKVDVTGAANKDFTVRIYRLGYYQGNGATLVQDLGTFTGVDQPDGIFESSTRLLDCGNWSVSAFWDVPSTAVSGIYLAKLTRLSNGGSSHIVFVVRDDARNADLLFKTSDATWQAYNNYGPSLYGSSDPGNPLSFNYDRAFKVSYNRPFYTRDARAANYVFNAEFALLQWLERNGYDVSYSTDVDFDRDLTPITLAKHRAILSVGHDEYWSFNERKRFEDARDAGVNLAFFSGNEIYWKTRWETSIDGSGTAHRTLVCYKEGTAADMGEFNCGSIDCDPDPAETWTGLWRFGGHKDAGRPENMLSGQMSWLEQSIPLSVPSYYRNLRFWRNTSVQSLSEGQTAVLGTQILGYEWDYEQDRFKSLYPSGRILMSNSSVTGDGTCCAFDEVLDNWYNSDKVSGKVYRHHLSLYRHSSGARVFAAGTINWSWGLESNHDVSNDPVVPAIQQATINILADMGAQPGSIQAGLLTASMSSDNTAPVLTITSPANNTQVGQGRAITVTGTAVDASGVVAGVEVSIDGGVSWTPAQITGSLSGTVNWSFSFTPSAVGTMQVLVRGVDDSGNLSLAGTSYSGTFINLEATCPCSVFSTLDAVDSDPRDQETTPITLGMKIRTSMNGFIVGARFYKDPENTGAHTAKLYDGNGNLLATAPFAFESASGWQMVTFATPVPVTANTTYVITYYSASGKYSVGGQNLAASITRGPIRSLADGEEGGNGVYAYGDVYPNNTFNASNYLVDAIFNTTTSCAFTPTLTALNPVCADAPINLRLSGVNGTAPYTLLLNETAVANVFANQTFTASHLVANPTTMVNVSIWPSGTGGAASAITDSRELGVRFRSTMPGYINAIRFYKTAESGTGTFPVRLYDTQNPAAPVGTGSITINASGVSGWQIATLSTPVLIEANRDYIASYVAPNGRYAASAGTMISAVTNGPLTAPANITGTPNGLYKTGAGTEAPAQEETPGAATNYWVDVVFTAVNQVRFTQIMDSYGVTCLSTSPNLTTLNLQPVNCAFLPVTLTDFKLSVETNTVALQWSTASENNNKGFEVQRSTDGVQWSAIGFVNGAINSQTVRKYSYTDKNLSEGRYYYRLKQVDLDEKSSYSKVISATISGVATGYALEQNYPNPSLGNTTITYSLPVRSQVVIALYDMQGRMVKQLVSETKEAGSHTVSLNTRDLSKGVYHYKMKAGEFQEVKRLLVN